MGWGQEAELPRRPAYHPEKGRLRPCRPPNNFQKSHSTEGGGNPVWGKRGGPCLGPAQDAAQAPTARAHGPRGALALLRPETALAGVSSTKPSAMDRSVRTDAAPGQRVSDGGGRELYTDNPKLRGDGKPVSREVSEQSREWERENRHAEGKACGF